MWGDLGVCPFEFEIWRTIVFLNYNYFLENAIEQEKFYIVSLEKLLFMKTLAIKVDKYRKDVELIVDDFIKQKYKDFDNEKDHNAKLLKDISVTYIEKRGPTS